MRCCDVCTEKKEATVRFNAGHRALAEEKFRVEGVDQGWVIVDTELCEGHLEALNRAIGAILGARPFPRTA